MEEMERIRLSGNAMAEGIKEMDKTHLMTFHPQGEQLFFFLVSSCRMVGF